jgi:hypothetical protein
MEVTGVVDGLEGDRADCVDLGMVESAVLGGGAWDLFLLEADLRGALGVWAFGGTVLLSGEDVAVEVLLEVG